MKRKVDHSDLYKHLTQQELLDYQKGVLGSEEMYRLELHLNECELCSDALEGMDQMKHPEAFLASINDSILPKQENSIPRSYLAMAASILLVAALGFTFWMLNPSGEDKSLAVNTTEEQAKKAEKQEPDKHANEEEGKLIDTTSNAKMEKTVPTNVEEPITKNKEQKPTTITQPEVSKLKLDANEASKVDTPVVQEQLADADRALEEDSEITIAKNDISDEETEGMAAPTASQDQAGVSQMRAAKKSAVSSLTSELLGDRKEPEPVGGMANYKTYLENNIIYPQEAIDNKVKGSVVLDVTISTQGAIKSIVVVKGLGFGCDEEAKRLVNDGPKWQPAVKEGNAFETTLQIKVRFKP